MEQNDFVFFKSASERKMLRKAAIKLVKYVHKNNIPIVISGGTSAQPAAYLFKVVWNELYKGDKKPHFYSLGEIATDIASFSISRTDHAKVPVSPPVSKLKEREMLIRKYRPALIKEIRKGKPIFILEEFVETGTTLEALKSLFSKLGAKKIKTGCLILYRWHAPNVKVDVAGTKGTLPRFYRSRRREKLQSITKRSHHETLKGMRKELRIIGSMQKKRLLR